MLELNSSAENTLVYELNTTHVSLLNRSSMDSIHKVSKF